MLWRRAAGGGDHGHVVDAELGGDVGVGPLPGEVLLAQPARVDRGVIGRAGQGDAVGAGAVGEELAGEPGLGLQVPECLARLHVFAVVEFAGQDGPGMLLPLPDHWQRGAAPLPRGPGDVFECEADVVGAGAQPRGGLGDGKL